MNDARTVLITGACGNLGSKLRQHLEGRYDLRLLDLDPKGDHAVVQADLADYHADWASQFRGVDTVVHLAATVRPDVDWPHVLGPNVDAVINVYNAAAANGVRRVVFASSNHAVGAYEDIAEPARLTHDIPPYPGSRLGGWGDRPDSLPYGSAKLFGERIGKCYADSHGLSTIAVRIGWNDPGENPTPTPRPDRKRDWLWKMWLSNRDFCQLFEKCITAPADVRFAIINGMSDNVGMRWDLGSAREVVGYEPEDGVGRGG